MKTISATLTNLMAAVTLADEYWHLQRPDYRNTLFHTHTVSRTLPNRDISIVSLTLPVPEAGDFVE